MDAAASSRGFQRFIGIGLGGGRGKTTAIARLERIDDGSRLAVAEARVRCGVRGGGELSDTRSPFRDQVLLDYLDEWVDERTVVAIDAPLTLPPCLSCTLACPGVPRCSVPIVQWMRHHAPRLRSQTAGRDRGKPSVTPYTQRATELLLEHVTLSPREALGQGMGPLAARASFLRRATAARLRLHENFIEIHPRATLIRCFGAATERKSRRADNETSWEVRKMMLARLAVGVHFEKVWPELVVRNVHVFDAVIGAMSAYLWDRDGWQGPSDLLTSTSAPQLKLAVETLGDAWLEAGWIWTPPAGGGARR
ncbi:MAG: DUF429 domain-containing protein [Nannocystaceae bacterium]